jgi:hypothetical protein
MNETISQNDPSQNEALMLLGGIRATDRVSQVLSSEVMRSTILFKDNKMHEHFGFPRFADFLDKSPFAPMTRAEFDRRRTRFEKEGEQLYDLLNDVGLSFRHRKLLGTGVVSIEGENIVLKEGEDEKVIPLRDRSLILETLKSLADANAEKAEKLKHGQTDYDALQKRVYDLQDGIGIANNKQTAEIDKQQTMTLGGLSALITALKKAPLGDVQQYAETSFTLLGLQVRELNELICEKLELVEVGSMADFGGDGLDRAAALLDD